MFNMFKPKEKALSSSKELKDVQMHVYTHAGGLIGRFIGRDLKIRVDGFDVIYDVERDTGRKIAKRVVVDTDSLAPVADVNEHRFERLMLTLVETDRVGRRAKTAVLDTQRFPTATFSIDSEDASSVEGRFTMRGEEHPLKCSKVLEGPELVFTCPIDYTKYGAPQYRHMLGLFSVRPTVDVVTRVPTKLLSL